ncbi:class I SAM-dependent methyltransferase [Niveispirillum sp. KHB5.9]|uniref:class I SAM-dependent methyltransferase n=1 Tax=Niveispirillum sp. KHB5.9 TaxID=3400269 RepID=UPI003A85FEA0
MASPLAPALADIRALLLDGDRLVRAVAGGRMRNMTPPWRRVELRPVSLKSGPHLQTVAYDERQAHTSNAAFGPDAEKAVDDLLALGLGTWHVETLDATVQLRVTKKGEAMISRTAAAAPKERALDHDRAKPRLLDPADPFWRAVGIADGEGRIKPTRQDKYRQVEEFIRALDGVLKGAEFAEGRPLRVVDLGCGNAYLTFAAYRFLTHVRGLEVDFAGVDTKRQARERNTELAATLGWDGLHFIEGTIAEAPVEGADIVLALHACDTATDDALARAVAWGAKYVLAAPCCHHDLQKQLRAGEAPAAYGLLTRHGILRERFADMLTDALRASLMRQAGYRTEIIEFVPSEHTPRNTLLRAVRTGAAAERKAVEEYQALVREWGVTPKLSVLLGTEAGF